MLKSRASFIVATIFINIFLLTTKTNAMIQDNSKDSFIEGIDEIAEDYLAKNNSNNKTNSLNSEINSSNLKIIRLKDILKLEKIEKLIEELKKIKNFNFNKNMLEKYEIISESVEIITSYEESKKENLNIEKDNKDNNELEKNIAILKEETTKVYEQYIKYIDLYLTNYKKEIEKLSNFNSEEDFILNITKFIKKLREYKNFTQYYLKEYEIPTDLTKNINITKIKDIKQEIENLNNRLSNDILDILLKNFKKNYLVEKKYEENKSAFSHNIYHKLKKLFFCYIKILSSTNIENLDYAEKKQIFFDEYVKKFKDNYLTNEKINKTKNMIEKIRTTLDECEEFLKNINKNNENSIENILIESLDFYKNLIKKDLPNFNKQIDIFDKERKIENETIAVADLTDFNDFMNYKKVIDHYQTNIKEKLMPQRICLRKYYLYDVKNFQTDKENLLKISVNLYNIIDYLNRNILDLENYKNFKGTEDIIKILTNIKEIAQKHKDYIKKYAIYLKDFNKDIKNMIEAVKKSMINLLEQPDDDIFDENNTYDEPSIEILKKSDKKNKSFLKKFNCIKKLLDFGDNIKFKKGRRNGSYWHSEKYNKNYIKKLINNFKKSKHNNYIEEYDCNKENFFKELNDKASNNLDYDKIPLDEYLFLYLQKAQHTSYSFEDKNENYMNSLNQESFKKNICHTPSKNTLSENNLIYDISFENDVFSKSETNESGICSLDFYSDLEINLPRLKEDIKSEDSKKNNSSQELSNSSIPNQILNEKKSNKKKTIDILKEYDNDKIILEKEIFNIDDLIKKLKKEENKTSEKNLLNLEKILEKLKECEKLIFNGNQNLIKNIDNIKKFKKFFDKNTYVLYKNADLYKPVLFQKDIIYEIDRNSYNYYKVTNKPEIKISDKNIEEWKEKNKKMANDYNLRFDVEYL